MSSKAELGHKYLILNSPLSSAILRFYFEFELEFLFRIKM